MYCPGRQAYRPRRSPRIQPFSIRTSRPLPALVVAVGELLDDGYRIASCVSALNTCIFPRRAQPGRSSLMFLGVQGVSIRLDRVELGSPGSKPVAGKEAASGGSAQGTWKAPTRMPQSAGQ